MKITTAALKRPVAVTVLAVAVAALGIFALKTLKVDYLPEVVYPMIKIHIWYRGATPEEIETNVAEPIEQVLATVDNLDYLQSSSIEGMYTLLVNFKYGVDVEAAYQDVTTAMGRVARRLPKEMDPPVIIKADPSQLPVMQVTVSSNKHSLVWLRDWAENWLTDRLNAVNGTAGVEIVGGLKREIRVHLDPRRLDAYGLTPAMIAKRLSGENLELFAGRITKGRNEIIARTMGEFAGIQEIEDVVVSRTPDGREVRIRDVASVEDSHEEMRVDTRFNGQTCIKLSILKQSEANTVEVARAVRKELQKLRVDIPSDIQFGYVEDQGKYVMDAIGSVESSAILAAILVILVVYLFLGRWRQVLVMVVAMPLTLLANFFVMKIAGFSLNLFSLGGLVVALGVILDNSIVVMENITRLKAEGAADAAQEGTDQVSSAIIASTLTFFAILLPFLFIPGLSSVLFKELVLVIGTIVVISLGVALTLTPALTGGLLKQERSGRASLLARVFSGVTDALTSLYGAMLKPALKMRWLVVLLTVALFVYGMYTARRAGSEFLPKLDDGRVMVKVKMPAGTSVGEIDDILGKIEKKLDGLPEIESMFALAGGRVWGLYTYEIANEGEVDIQLVPKSKRSISTKKFIAKIKPIVGKIPAPGGKIPVMQMKVKGIRKKGTQEADVKIRGTDLKAIYGFAKKVAGTLGGVSGLTNVNISMDMTKPEYRIFVDRARASALGISIGDVARTLHSLINGTVATKYREGTEYYNVRVMVPEPDLTEKSDIEWLVVKNVNGRPIYLRDVADVKRAAGPVEIVREDQVKQVVVGVDAEGISVGDAVSRARAAVAEMKIPHGVHFEMGGQAEMMRDNRRSMMLIALFAVLFAFVILAIQFESFSLPFLIILDVPFALTGAFIALVLAGEAFGVTVQIGLIVMMGAITSQGVVLLTLAEQYRKQGMTRLAAVAKAAPIRLRPILMTQLTTILGLVPLALNLGEGGDMLKPMAIATIGGLLYSLVLTLFFLPAAYSLGKGGAASAEPVSTGGNS